MKPSIAAIIKKRKKSKMLKEAFIAIIEDDIKNNKSISQSNSDSKILSTDK